MNNALRLQFAQLLEEVTYYMVLVGVFYLCVFILAAFFIACWESLGPQPGLMAYFRRMGRLALFLALLLLVGDFFGVIWTAIIHNRMYYNPGYDGVDFVPWYPLTRDLVDATYGADTGRLIGVKFWQLEVIWFVFAVSTWTTTMMAFEKITELPDVAPRRRAGCRG